MHLIQVRPRTTLHDLIKTLNTNVVGVYLKPLNRSVGTSFYKWYLSEVLIFEIIRPLEEQASSNWSKHILLWHPCVMLHTKCMCAENVAVCFLTPALPTTNLISPSWNIPVRSHPFCGCHDSIQKAIDQQAHSWASTFMRQRQFMVEGFLCGLGVRLIHVCTPWWAVIHKRVFVLSFINRILVAEALLDVLHAKKKRCWLWHVELIDL